MLSYQDLSPVSGVTSHSVGAAGASLEIRDLSSILVNGQAVRTVAVGGSDHHHHHQLTLMGHAPQPPTPAPVPLMVAEGGMEPEHAVVIL